MATDTPTPVETITGAKVPELATICLLYFPERENPPKTSFFRIYYDKHTFAARNAKRKPTDPPLPGDMLEQVVLLPGPNFCDRELWEWLKEHPQLAPGIQIRMKWDAIVEREPTALKPDIPATNTTTDYDPHTASELISVCYDEAWLKSCLPFEKRTELLSAINARIARLQRGEVNR